MSQVIENKLALDAMNGFDAAMGEIKYIGGRPVRAAIFGAIAMQNRIPMVDMADGDEVYDILSLVFARYLLSLRDSDITLDPATAEQTKHSISMYANLRSYIQESFDNYLDSLM